MSVNKIKQNKKNVLKRYDLVDDSLKREGRSSKIV